MVGRAPPKGAPVHRHQSKGDSGECSREVPPSPRLGCRCSGDRLCVCGTGPAQGCLAVQADPLRGPVCRRRLNRRSGPSDGPALGRTARSKRRGGEPPRRRWNRRCGLGGAGRGRRAHLPVHGAGAAGAQSLPDEAPALQRRNCVRAGHHRGRGTECFGDQPSVPGVEFFRLACFCQVKPGQDDVWHARSGHHRARHRRTDQSADWAWSHSRCLSGVSSRPDGRSGRAGRHDDRGHDQSRAAHPIRPAASHRDRVCPTQHRAAAGADLRRGGSP